MHRMDVSIGFIQQGDTYILQRRSIDPRKGAAGLIGAFGGKIEQGESPLEAVCRELSEETSLKPSTEDFKYLGEVDVIADRDHKAVQIMARVFSLNVPTDRVMTALEGELVMMTQGDALKNRDALTPATRAAFEQLI